MGALERPRKDGTVAWQVIVRPTGGKTVAKTFDDKATAELFEEMMKKEMQATRLRKALAARERKGPPAHAMKRDSYEEHESDPEAAQREYQEELLVETLRKYSKTREISKKAAKSMPSILKTVGEVKLGQLKKRWVKQYIDHLRTVPWMRRSADSFTLMGLKSGFSDSKVASPSAEMRRRLTS